MRLGKDVTKGVYRERKGKCEMRIGERGGGEVSRGCATNSARRFCSDSENERWRFQMSTKLENTEVSSARSSSGVGPSKELISGVRKCYGTDKSVYSNGR